MARSGDGEKDGKGGTTPRLARELESFGSVWEGGYFEGDPLDPFAHSYFGRLGYMSILHATYLRCIKPYVKAGTVALEIGPGRGAWTRTMLPAQEIYALDALAEEHNQFYQYLGHPRHVKYIQVRDFSCRELPDDHFDFMFSFGCLCHVSFEGITQYARNTYPKMKRGADCFWMIADYDKYNWAVAHLDYLKFQAPASGAPRRYPPLPADKTDEPSPGRWYHAGMQRTCTVLEQAGYRIADPDVGTDLRDPIIHFRKD